ncbi:hypothetical protein BGZ76_011277 [Entomortierella beljakovae]|nr:hypothetical protein BGZ76_011277 [Entomortierella beljakovae]
MATEGVLIVSSLPEESNQLRILEPAHANPDDILQIKFGGGIFKGWNRLGESRFFERPIAEYEAYLTNLHVDSNTSALSTGGDHEMNCDDETETEYEV